MRYELPKSCQPASQLLYTFSRGRNLRIHYIFELNKMASIPLYVTIKPKNLSELTPNAHLKGLGFILYFRNSSKAFVDAWCDQRAFWTLQAYHRYRPPWFLLTTVGIS